MKLKIRQAGVTLALMSFFIGGPTLLAAQESSRLDLNVFSEHIIHFSPDEPDRYDTLGSVATDNGRVITSHVELPDWRESPTIIAHLIIQPIPKDDLQVHDKWDRAGNIRLSRRGMEDIELMKFITAYGGATEYELDLSHLATLLRGPCEIAAFIDTWVSPGWLISLTLTYRDNADSDRPDPDWAHGQIFEQGFDRDSEREGGLTSRVVVPSDIRRVMLYYYVSGHCTDGRGADEFESKDNVITVDGVVVHRYRPWRDDCRDFRAINPYCRRWSDGSWSCDYDRSGWCPGDMVEPLILDLTDHLTPGDHTLNVQIDGVRPKDDEGHKGYWRVSAYLVGYR